MPFIKVIFNTQHSTFFPQNILLDTRQFNLNFKCMIVHNFLKKVQCAQYDLVYYNYV